MKGGDSPGVFPGFNWDAEALSPWDTTRVPGWSSSGGAAATVSRMIPVALGSDGGGSTRLPAAYSGVVGLHTSRGLIPHINYEKPMMLLTASYGPLARDVHDVALFTDVLGGPDGRDYVSIPFDSPSCIDSIDAGVEGMRLAWTENFGYADRYATEALAIGPDNPQALTTRALTALRRGRSDQAVEWAGRAVRSFGGLADAEGTGRVHGPAVLAVVTLALARAGSGDRDTARTLGEAARAVRIGLDIDATAFGALMAELSDAVGGTV